MHIEYDFYQHKMTYKGDVDRGIMPFLIYYYVWRNPFNLSKAKQKYEKYNDK